jgi:hypothetical protein
MHTIQYIAVQADDVDHAHGSVKHYLETVLGSGDNYNSWFDWFVTGGGRWATGEDNQYNDSYTGDVVHQSSPKFQEYLDTVSRFKKESLQQYIDEAKKLDIPQLLESIDTSGGDDFRSGMELYPLTKLYDMTMGKWDFNSYFYDMVHDSTNTIHMRKLIDNGADNWYLVPVDFHF